MSGFSEEPNFFIEIFVQPGEFYWGDSDTRIRTILGSCIAICLWHPVKRVGGMCHFMLPGMSKSQPLSGRDRNTPARYSEDALELFLEEIKKSRTVPSEYEAKIFGGGCLICDEMGKGGDSAIGNRNIESAKRLLSDRKVKIVAEDLGGNFHRKIFFDLWDGEVWLKRTRYSVEPNLKIHSNNV
jgi:chemotaxis protein CheD